MTAPRVLVTPRSLTRDPAHVVGLLTEAGCEPVLGPAGRQPSVEELRALLPGCAGYLAGVEPVPREVLEAADALRVISRNGVGTDAIDLAAAAERGIEVRRAAGANAAGVAELAVGLLFAALRHLPDAVAGVRAGGWERPVGREVAGSTVGVVGFGAIGREVAHRLLALGAHVLVADPAVDPADVAPPLQHGTLEHLLAAADAVTLHLPALPDGRPLLGAAELTDVGPGAVLLNTSRASLVDRDAVVAALDDGRLTTYAVDAFEVEPPPAGDPLVGHPGVLPTPHLGGHTVQSVARATEAAVANLVAVLTATASPTGTEHP